MPQSGIWRSHDWRITLIFLIALGLRIGWAIHLPRDPANLAALPDQIEYLQLGEHLARGEGLQFQSSRYDEPLRAYRMPGYPALLAACDGNLSVIRIVQSVIDAANVFAVFLLAKKWLGNGASLLAAIFIALNPFLIYFSGLILSETLFASMLIWSCVMLFSDRSRWWLLGIFTLALSVLVRPSALGLPTVLGAVSALLNARGQMPYYWRIFQRAIVGLLITIIVLAGWAWRNERVLHHWIWTTTNGGISAYDGLRVGASGASDQTFLDSMPQLRAMSEVQRNEYFSKQASQFVREHPVETLKLAIVKIARLWSPIPLSAQFGVGRLVLISAAFMIPLQILIVLGLCFGQFPAPAKLCLMLPAIYFTLVHAAAVGSLRYRVPADVPMTIVSASAIPFFTARRARQIS